MRTKLSPTLLVAALAACGDGNTNHLADAPITVDAPHGTDAPAIDAPAIDAAQLPVTASVTDGGAPASGATVYFLNADNTVVLSTTTGSDGTASAVMAPGGSVTVIEPGSGAAILDTFLDAKPGDVLHVDRNAAPGTSITVNVTVPLDDNTASAVYTLFTPCGSQQIFNGLLRRAGFAGTTTASVTLSGCAATTDFLIGTTDATGADVDWLYAPGVAVADGQAVTLTGAYAAFATQDYAYSNLTNIGSVSLQPTLASAAGALFASSASVPTPTNGSAATTYDLPGITTGVVAIQESVFTSDGTVPDDQTIADWGAPATPPAPIAFDYSTARLVDFTSPPAFDATTQQLGWTTSTTGVAPNALWAQLGVTRTDPTTQAATNWTWNLAGPGTANGALTFPTLPTDVFAFNPTAADTVAVNDAELANAPGGYDSVRALANEIEFDQAAFQAGASGRVAFEYFNGIVGGGAALAKRSVVHHHGRRGARR